MARWNVSSFYDNGSIIVAADDNAYVSQTHQNRGNDPQSTPSTGSEPTPRGTPTTSCSRTRSTARLRRRASDAGAGHVVRIGRRRSTSGSAARRS